MTEPLSFRVARPSDAGVVAALVNSGYRGEESKAGWTTEADLLEGLRTDEAEIRGLIEDEGSLMLLCVRGTETIGSVHLRRDGDAAYLGLLVVKPVLQGAGVGKRFIQAAEDLVRREWGVATMTMSVISLRSELIAFYERRGYRRTGRLSPFPVEDALSVPRVDGLQFETLEKDLRRP